MRKLIVSNFVTLDGLYEGKEKISTLFMTTITQIIAATTASISIMRKGCVPPISVVESQFIFRQQGVLDERAQ